jgi:hypothetical protein
MIIPRAPVQSASGEGGVGQANVDATGGNESLKEGEVACEPRIQRKVHMLLPSHTMRQTGKHSGRYNFPFISQATFHTWHETLLRKE